MNQLYKVTGPERSGTRLCIKHNADLFEDFFKKCQFGSIVTLQVLRQTVGNNNRQGIRITRTVNNGIQLRVQASGNNGCYEIFIYRPSEISEKVFEEKCTAAVAELMAERINSRLRSVGDGVYVLEDVPKKGAVAGAVSEIFDPLNSVLMAPMPRMEQAPAVSAPQNAAPHNTETGSTSSRWPRLKGAENLENMGVVLIGLRERARNDGLIDRNQAVGIVSEYIGVDRSKVGPAFRLLTARSFLRATKDGVGYMLDLAAIDQFLQVVEGEQQETPEVSVAEPVSNVLQGNFGTDSTHTGISVPITELPRLLKREIELREQSNVLSGRLSEMRTKLEAALAQLQEIKDRVDVLRSEEAKAAQEFGSVTSQRQFTDEMFDELLKLFK